MDKNLPFSLKKIELNAVRNVLCDVISIEYSCLTAYQRKSLMVAVNAYLRNPVSFPEDSAFHIFAMSCLSNTHKGSQLLQTSKVYYDVIKFLLKNGETLLLNKFKVEIKESTDVALDDKSKNKKQDNTDDAGLNSEEIYRRRYESLVRSLIFQQQKDSVEYFEKYIPYSNNRHIRRFTFEAKNKRKSTEDFISELRDIYGDVYDYSLVKYVNGKTMVSLRCKKHDHIFSRLPLNLLKGFGCPLCNKEQGKTWKNTVEKNYSEEKRSSRWDTARFIEESISVFGEGVFDYSLCNYVNNKTPVTLIQVSTGKRFSTYPYEHLRHRPYQDTEDKSYYQGTTDQQKIHYIVKCISSEVDHEVYVPMQHIESCGRFKCICPIHGDFYTSLQRIHNGKCCPECDVKKESIGERNVRRYLQSKNIAFVQEYTVRDIKYFSSFVRVDFYIPGSNIFIEFQGEQHYNIMVKQIRHGKTWREQKKRDNHLRKYAKDKNIKLIEVPYTYRTKVDEFLNQYF